jgi:hypothetical protein
VQGHQRGLSNAGYLADEVLVPRVVSKHAGDASPASRSLALPLLSLLGGSLSDARSPASGASSSSSASASRPPHPSAPTQGAATADGTAAGSSDTSPSPSPSASDSTSDSAAATAASASTPPLSRSEALRQQPVAAAEDRAFRLYSRAAELQDSIALVKIGDFHFYGRAGLPASAEKAASYYKMAADQSKHPQVWRPSGGCAHMPL